MAGDIMLAARDLYETEGVAATSLAAIARKAGVTRTLVYYYFPSKQAVTDAVLDGYLEDLVESVSTWNELRAFGDTPSELKNCVSMLRRALYTASGSPRPMFAVLDELGMRDQFATQAVREIVACIQSYIVSEYMAYRTMTCGLFFYGAGAGQDPPPQIKTAGTDPLPIPAAWRFALARLRCPTRPTPSWRPSGRGRPLPTALPRSACCRSRSSQSRTGATGRDSRAGRTERLR